MDLIYSHPNGGKIYQCGYREIPRDLVGYDIDLVVYCASECPPLNDYFHKPGNANLYYFPNEDWMVTSADPRYKWMFDQAKPAAKLLAEQVGQGKKAIVCCSQGINRSSLATGLAMKQLTDWTGEKIVATIRAARDGTLCNSAFVSMIIQT